MSDSHSPQPSGPRAGHLRVVHLHDPGDALGRLEAGAERLQVRFDPIADLSRGVVAGFEVLVGLDGEDDAAAPRAWSDDVHPDAAGRVEALLVRRALAQRERLPANTYLLVNVSPAALRSPELPAERSAAGRLERVVFIVADDADPGGAHDVRRSLA